MNRLRGLGLGVGVPASISVGFLANGYNYESWAQIENPEFLDKVIQVGSYALGAVFAFQAVNHAVMLIRQQHQESDN